MNIYLDTNILLNEHYFRAPTITALVKASSFLGLGVLIPEIVIDELKGNHTISLEKAVINHDKAIRELQRVIDIENDEIDVKDKTDEYADYLDEFVEEHNINVLPYPKFSDAKSLVTASYERKKPFKENGDGYKDYVVWETICASINELAETENYFLTDNVIDFCANKSANPPLHTELLEKIEDKDKIPKVYRSAIHFFEEVIRPRLPGIEIKDIPDISFEEINDLTIDELDNQLINYECYGFEGLPFNGEVSIVDVEDAKIQEVKCVSVDQKQILITAHGTVFIEVHGFIEKFDFYSSLEDQNKDIYIIDGNWNDHVMLAGAGITIPFDVLLTYDKSEKDIVQKDIKLPTEIINDYY